MVILPLEQIKTLSIIFDMQSGDYLVCIRVLSITGNELIKSLLHSILIYESTNNIIYILKVYEYNTYTYTWLVIKKCKDI